MSSDSQSAKLVGRWVGSQVGWSVDIQIGRPISYSTEFMSYVKVEMDVLIVLIVRTVSVSL